LPTPSAQSPTRLNDAHLTHVLELVRQRRATTRPELMRVSGLSRKIVIQRVDQLIAFGLVRERPATTSTGGRPAGQLEFVAEAGCVLVAELGSTGMTAALADLSGQVLRSQSRRLPFAPPPQVALGRVEQLFTRFLDNHSARGPLLGIGVGVLGPVSPKGLTMDLLPNGGWADFSVPDWFGSRFGVPVWVDNEVNMMALGESRRRRGDQRQNLLYVNVGTGLGGGLVSDGRLFRGASGVAGELGHMRVSPDRSLRCWCGDTGCVATLASGQSIARSAVRAMREERSPFLRDIPARQIRDTHVVAGAHAGDEVCSQIMARAGEALGRAIAAATNLLNPALVVIGGRVGGQAANLLTDPVRRAVEDHAFPLASEAITVESSEDASAMGIAGVVTTVVEGLLSGIHLDAMTEAGRVPGEDQDGTAASDAG
jgi:predicted NBD/HSP70 family sugar kinase